MQAQTALGASRISIDASAFPLAIVTFDAGPLSDDDYRTFIDGVNALMLRGEKFVMLVDTLKMSSSADAKQRRMLSDWINEERWRARARFKIADTLIIRSPLVRGAMTAVLWISPPASPTKVFGSIEDATPWIRERCAEEGVVITPAMELRLARRR